MRVATPSGALSADPHVEIHLILVNVFKGLLGDIRVNGVL
jgi:hypothetical protein